MAITAPTTLSDFSGFIPAEIAAPIFEDAAEQSAVQRLGQRLELGLSGQAIPVVTSRPTASWVSEAGQKAASSGKMSLKTMSPKKLATIVVVSEEVVRANPANYVELIRSQMAEAFATAFDSAALHGTNTPFANYVDETTHSVALGTNAADDGGIYADVVAGMGLVLGGGNKVRGFLFDETSEVNLLGAVDTTGRPLWVGTPLEDTVSAVIPGRLLGRTSLLASGVKSDDIIGYCGDWNQVAWGVVGGINYRVSTEASVTIDGSLVSLFEYNLVAILAEAEYGLVINNVDAFCQYTDGESS